MPSTTGAKRNEAPLAYFIKILPDKYYCKDVAWSGVTVDLATRLTKKNATRICNKLNTMHIDSVVEPINPSKK